MLAIMTTYRCVLIVDDGMVKAAPEVFAVTNAGAIEQARRLQRRSAGCAAFEVWWEQNLLHAEGLTPDPKPAA